jgi:hypothetical protein
MLQRDQKFRGKVEVAKKRPLERCQPQEHVEEINNTSNRESNIQSEWLRILPQSMKSATHATGITHKLQNSVLLDSDSGFCTFHNLPQIKNRRLFHCRKHFCSYIMIGYRIATAHSRTAGGQDTHIINLLHLEHSLCT